MMTRRDKQGKRVNDWGQTYKQWADNVHDDLVKWTEFGLGDLTIDLENAWLEGLEAGEISAEQKLLSPSEQRDIFGDSADE